MTNTLLGNHVVSGPRNNYDGTLYRGIVSFEHGAIDPAVGEVKPDCFTVWRNINQYGNNNADHPPGFDNFNETQAAANAEWWWTAGGLRTSWDAHPARAYKLGNEVGANNEQVVRSWIAFEKRMIQLNEEAGRPYTFLIQSLANDTPDWNNGLWQEVIAPFIVYAWERGHIYTRHAYCDNGPYATNKMIVNGLPSNPGTDRPFREFRWFIDAYGYCGPMVLGEVGYVTFPGANLYVQEMAAYDLYAMSYEYRGHRFADSCGFMACFTDGEWWSANKQNANPLLNQYLAANPYTPWVPSTSQPEPAPDERPKIVIVKKPQKAEMTKEENKAIGDLAWDEYGRTTTHSHNDMLSMMSIGNAESYAVVWYPERPSQKEAIAMLKEAGFNYKTLPETVPPDPPDYIEIAPISQRDPRWINKLCGTGPKTIGTWGCLLVVYDMLAAHWGINNGRLPDAENNYYVARGGFSGNNLVSMAMSKVYSQVKNEGWLTRDNSAMHGRTQDYLARGIPVPARVDFNPATGQWEQHWVLLVGWDGEDYLMNDPWTGKQGVRVSEFYGIAGSDVLECIYYFLDEAQPVKIDLLPYLKGDGRLYEVRNSWGSQERFQTQDRGNGIFWQTKNTAAEMLYVDGNFIWRDWDTSPGNGRFYRQQAQQGTNGAKWLPRWMAVGESFTISLYVQYYTWNCNKSAANSGAATDTRKLVAHHPVWTSRAGITLEDVLELQWVNGGETYFYPQGFGLGAWERTHQDPNTPQWSAISEIHDSGQRPDNVVDLPGCLL